MGQKEAQPCRDGSPEAHGVGVPEAVEALSASEALEIPLEGRYRDGHVTAGLPRLGVDQVAVGDGITGQLVSAADAALVAREAWRALTPALALLDAALAAIGTIEPTQSRDHGAPRVGLQTAISRFNDSHHPMLVTTNRANRLIVNLPRVGGRAVIGPSPDEPGVGDLVLVAAEARKTLGPALELLDAALGLLKTLEPK